MHETSNFSKIVYRQIISLIIHCITIPVSQKFTYTKLTVPAWKIAWKIPENYVMALEASDRLIDIILVNWRCTCGCISRPTFKLSVSLLDVMGNQTVVRKYKHHGTTQPSYRSGRRRVLSPRDEHTFVRKVQINPRTTANDLVKCWMKRVQKYLYPQ